MAENVYFVLNSLYDWKPMKRMKHRTDVVSFMLVFVVVEKKEANKARKESWYNCNYISKAH